MKVIAVVLLFFAGAIGKAAIHEIMETGPACPLDDPLLRPEEGSLNISVDPIFSIEQGSIRAEVVVTGLSTFWYEYTINILTLVLTFNIKVGELDVRSRVTATGYIDARPFSHGCIPSGNFTAEDNVVLELSELDIVGNATIFINIIGDKISFRILNLGSFTFSSLSANLGANYRIGGEPVNWDSFNANIKTCVDSELAANKPEVTEKVRTAINGVIDDYTLQEFIDLIGGDPANCTTTA